MNVSLYQTDEIVTPQAMVVRGVIEYDLAFGRGVDNYSFIVRIYAPRSDELAAQALFDDLCSPLGDTSVKTLLEADNALQLATQTKVRVRTVSEVQIYPSSDPNIEYLVVDFDVEVLVNNH